MQSRQYGRDWARPSHFAVLEITGGCVDQQPLFDSEATGSLTEQAIGWPVMGAFFRAT